MSNENDKTVKILKGEIEMDYKWAPGNTVGRFLTSLRDSKEILAVRCPVTSRVYLPPQAWSPYANVKMDRFQTVNTKAKLKVGSIVYRAPWNMPEGANIPYMLAAVHFPGADTELMHLVFGSESVLKSLKEGDELEPVWKEQRAGTIRDLDHFVPATQKNKVE